MDAEVLLPAKKLYSSGMTGIEGEFARYMDAVAAIEKSGIPRELLSKEKAEMYAAVAEVNREIRLARSNIALCDEIVGNMPHIEKDVEIARQQVQEIKKDDHNLQK